VPPRARTIRVPIAIRCSSVNELDSAQLVGGLESALSKVFINLTDRMAVENESPTLVLAAADLVTPGVDPDQANRLLDRIDATIARVAAVRLPAARPLSGLVQRTARSIALGPPPPVPQTTGDWLDVDSHDQALREYVRALDSGDIQRSFSGYQGFLYRIHGEVGVTIVRFPAGDVILQGTFGVAYHYGIGPDNKPVRTAIMLPAGADYEIHYYCARNTDVQNKIARFFEPTARIILGPHRREFDDFGRAVRVAAGAMADIYLKDHSDKVAFGIMKVGVDSFIVGLQELPPTDLKADLIVLNAVASRARPAVEVAAEIQGPGGQPSQLISVQCDSPVDPETNPATGDIVYSCDPFCGEPSVLNMGSWGMDLLHEIDWIATELGIDSCNYAAQFVLVAARTIGLRALAVAGWSIDLPGETKATPGGEGNLGTLDLNYVKTPQIQELKRLARLVPKISRLHSNVIHYTEFLGGDWGLAYLSNLNKRFEHSIGLIFAMSCQVIFMQLLTASRLAIEARQNSSYVERFRIAVLPQLMSILELEQLLDALRSPDTARELPWSAGASTESGVQPGSWETSTKDFTEVLASAPTNSLLIEGEPQVTIVGGDLVVRDRLGRLWDEESLGIAIQLRRGLAESIEPMIKQVEELPDFIEDMGEKQKDIDGAVARLLDRMHAKNDEIRVKAKADSLFAFNLTVGRSRLQGLQKQADEAIADAFEGDPWYRIGRDSLINMTEGGRALEAVLEFSGLVVLAIFCAPAAAILGFGLAGHQYAEAKQKEDVYQALINPELVLSYANVEASLFAAKIGFVLAFIPVGFEFAGLLNRAFGLVAKEGLSVFEAVTTAGREAVIETAQETVSELLASCERGLALALFEGGVEAFFYSKVIEAALAPIIDAVVQRYGEVGPVGGLAEGMAALIQQENAASPSVGAP